MDPCAGGEKRDEVCPELPAAARVEGGVGVRELRRGIHEDFRGQVQVFRYVASDGEAAEPARLLPAPNDGTDLDVGGHRAEPFLREGRQDGTGPLLDEPAAYGRRARAHLELRIDGERDARAIFVEESILDADQRVAGTVHAGLSRDILHEPRNLDLELDAFPEPVVGVDER